MWLMGFDYNFMNNMSINLEYNSLLRDNKEVQITNNSSKHQINNHNGLLIRYGYNFDLL